MPASIKDMIDLRVLCRLISYGDLILNGLVVIVMSVWNFVTLYSNAPEKPINGTISSSDLKPESAEFATNLMAKWLFYLVILLTFLLRASGAFALCKGTAKDKDLKKALKHCVYWITINILFILFVGWLFYERYAGTFANVSPLDAADVYGIYALLFITAILVGAVGTFIAKLCLR